MRLSLPLIASAALIASLGGAAQAHSPFLQPLNFAPSRDYVTVIGGMHEESAFVSDFAIRPGDLFVVGPDGARARLEGQATLKGITAVDVPLPGPGTYKITTGDRTGRDATLAKVDGVWRMVRPAGGPGRPAGGGEHGEGPGPIEASAVPAGAPTVKTSALLKAETYVSRGAPSAGALKASGQGYELEPVTHPNEIFLDKGFRFRLLVDGKPAQGAKVLVRRADEAYAEKKTELTLTADAAGAATLKPAKPGAYILETKWPAVPPAGAEPAAKSYTLTVAVEVTP